MSLRCDNTACIAMLEEPGWRARYISIYGEVAKQKMIKVTCLTCGLLVLAMCDPSLTDTGGRSSEFPEEAEPWREVDLTDVEEKMRGLKMEQEADFSEPEQAQLVQPVLAVDGTGTLPASGDGGALPTSGDGPKHVADEKKKVIVLRDLQTAW